MLDAFLTAAYRQTNQEKEKRAFIEDLKKLPMNELQKLASGELKIGHLCGPDGGEDWLSKYKGTSLFEQAIGLEQQEIQIDVARQQARQQEPPMDQFYKQQDQVRLQKRLLDLQLVQAQAGGDPSAAPAAPEAPAQGAGAPGMGAANNEEMMSPGPDNGMKTGSVKTALLGPLLAGAFGAHKAPEGEEAEGALRGAGGYFGGSALGGAAGGIAGGALGGTAGLIAALSAKDPHLAEALLRGGVGLGAGVGALAGGVGGGVAGYKSLTRKYNKKEAAAPLSPTGKGSIDVAKHWEAIKKSLSEAGPKMRAGAGDAAKGMGKELLHGLPMRAAAAGALGDVGESAGRALAARHAPISEKAEGLGRLGQLLSGSRASQLDAAQQEVGGTFGAGLARKAHGLGQSRFGRAAGLEDALGGVHGGMMEHHKALADAAAEEAAHSQMAQVGGGLGLLGAGYGVSKAMEPSRDDPQAYLGKMAEELLKTADSMGRALARSDAEQMQKEAKKVPPLGFMGHLGAAGEAAKTHLGGLNTGAGGMPLVGALGGAAAGAVSGMDPDARGETHMMRNALMGGAAGGAAGLAAHHMGGGMGALAGKPPVPAAAPGVGAAMLNTVKEKLAPVGAALSEHAGTAAAAAGTAALAGGTALAHKMTTPESRQAVVDAAKGMGKKVTDYASGVVNKVRTPKTVVTGPAPTPVRPAPATVAPSTNPWKAPTPPPMAPFSAAVGH